MNKKGFQFNFRRSPDLPFRVVDEEVVIVSPPEGEITVLNETAAKIWQLLDGKRTLQQIADILAHEFEVERGKAYSDCFDFIKKLEQKGFVQSEY